MSVEDWQKPSAALKRIAETTDPPSQRACPTCHHRHMKKERCGYQLVMTACRCTS